MKSQTPKTVKISGTDALKVLDRRIPMTLEMERLLEVERINTEAGQKIYELRKKAGLTQRELAEKIGRSQSVISELEDANYDGNSLEMLASVFHALGCRMDIKVVTPRRKQLEPA
ncbi:MAG TPA: helix-turn-helix transcriptional regulator [Opitutaceae bacterium]|nr:helix-turn-helix transcriptional regulator [Opitutaceae bacterium]